jgi:hypothetical protein
MNGISLSSRKLIFEVNCMKMGKILMICTAVILAASCRTIGTRVLEQTNTTAVIEAKAATTFEAKKNGLKRASEELEGEVVESQPAECKQGYSHEGSTTGTGKDQQYSEKSSTYEVCVVFAKKK